MEDGDDNIPNGNPENPRSGNAPVTELLKAWSNGDRAALNTLTPLIYDELRKLARSAFRGERVNHTLQPTAVVHEAFANLINSEIAWENRAHFYALCARMMRRILVDHARTQGALKRGGDVVRTSITGNLVDEAASTDLLDLDTAMLELTELDPRKAELIELQLFAGLSFKEMAETTGLSSSTLDRELRMAKAWLADRLDGL